MSLLKVDAITGKSDTTEVNSPITFTANSVTITNATITANTIKKPTLPAFVARMTTSITAMGLDTDNNVFDTTSSSYLNFDQGNHYDETNKKFVAPIAGLYWFHASWDLRDEIVNNVTYYYMHLTLNGDTKFHHIYDHVGSADSFYHTIVLNGMMDLSVNDEVTALARQVGGSNMTNIDNGAGTFFMGYFIG